MTAQYDVSVEDIEYLKVREASLLARLWPKGEGPFLVLSRCMAVRGSGNDRLTNVDIDQALAASGVVVMAIDFRMPPAAQYPEPVADINFAIRWLRANAERFASRPGQDRPAWHIQRRPSGLARNNAPDRPALHGPRRCRDR